MFPTPPTHSRHYCVPSKIPLAYIYIVHKRPSCIISYCSVTYPVPTVDRKISTPLPSPSIICGYNLSISPSLFISFSYAYMDDLLLVIFIALTFEVIFEKLNIITALLWLMSSLFLHKKVQIYS